MSDKVRALLVPGGAIPAHEARQLIAHLLGCAPAELINYCDQHVDRSAYDALVARRMAGEPLQLIIGTAGFWDFECEVSKDTLIPRPDSETVVEAALQACAQAHGRVLDLGTGTGCLLLAFLRERADWVGFGVDLAPAAAALARRNAGRAGVGGRAWFWAGCWGKALEGRFDLVLSNPPYIPSRDIGGLESEVRDWEPGRALDGGVDGLAAYRALVEELPLLLAPGGVAVFELGIGQATAVGELARLKGLKLRGVRRDLGGIDRALILSR